MSYNVKSIHRTIITLTRIRNVWIRLIVIYLIVEINCYFYHTGREVNIKLLKHVKNVDAHEDKVKNVLLQTLSEQLGTNVLTPFFPKQCLVAGMSGNTIYALSQDGVLWPHSFNKNLWPDYNIKNIAEYSLTLYLALCDISQRQHYIDKNSKKYYMIFGLQ